MLRTMELNYHFSGEKTLHRANVVANCHCRAEELLREYYINNKNLGKANKDIIIDSWWLVPAIESVKIIL